MLSCPLPRPILVTPWGDFDDRFAAFLTAPVDWTDAANVCVTTPGDADPQRWLDANLAVRPEFDDPPIEVQTFAEINKHITQHPTTLLAFVRRNYETAAEAP